MKELRKLKRTVYLMCILGIITFLSGFLKYTPLEHSTLLLLLLLFLGGLRLLKGARSNEINGISRIFLVLTGLSTAGFIILIVVAIIRSLTFGVSLSDNLEVSEGLFYLTSLIFIIGLLGGIIFLNIRGGRRTKGA